MVIVSVTAAVGRQSFAGQARPQHPEKRVRGIAKRIEKELGKDKRREFHDLKDRALGDRTLKEALDDAKSLYENAGKEAPRWLLDQAK